ncbi:hypothetical protein BKA70DRAFT_460861 [Coprinopsis sp. MPI-PUGE-AT-0042]|nr:hypothetical protein BKA70DRAFT_460861 [Coprinopsis sp. MPI-PUGE-AT-0042]
MSKIATVKPASGKLNTPSASTSAPVLRTGTLYVRERTAFGGRTWKSKGVVLDEQHLIIQQPASNRQTRLPLKAITELERTDLMNHSLSIRCAGKVYHVAFDNDTDLYDWRDDMYSRCPLGAQTTSPFNFQHTSHIGTDGPTGTFAEPSTLTQYEEMMGRSKGAAVAASGTESAGSRTRSPQTAAARRRSHILMASDKNVNIEGGTYLVKQTGMFSGLYWKERWISLKGDTLIVHTRKTKGSRPSKQIPLSAIKSVEPDPKRSNCLLVTTTTRETCISILFSTDADMYTWRETIYLRSGLSAFISEPTDFVHAMHVTVDAETGEFKGLPDQWKNVIYGHHSAHIVDLPIPAAGNTASRPTRRRLQPLADTSNPVSASTKSAPSPSLTADTRTRSP